MRTRSKVRVGAVMRRARTALLAGAIAIFGLLAFATPAWAMQVRVVDAEGNGGYIEKAEEHETWSWDGKGTITLNGFHGSQISFTGGDLTIVLVGENTLESTVEEFSAGLFYAPVDETPTERTLTITGLGVLGMDGGISNLGAVAIKGANVVIAPVYKELPPASGVRFCVSASELDVLDDAEFTIKEGGISTSVLNVKDSTLDVSYTLSVDTPITVGDLVTFDNSFITVKVKDPEFNSVTAGTGIKLENEGLGVNMGELCLIGDVSLSPIGLTVLTDVDGETFHLSDILWLFANGITTGFPDSTFRPLDSVARCDMAAFLYRLAGKPAYTPTDKDKAYFSDVDEETPHAKEVWWLASKGISVGWDEGDGTHTFRPYDNIARCDMAAFLYRLAGEPAFAPMAADMEMFNDIDSTSPHANEVWWLASVGVSTGFPDSTFRPYDEIARCDMAAFLHRMEKSSLI